MVTTIDWFAPDGRKLSFQVLQYSGNWNPVSGVYMFCRRELNGSYTPLYIGQAASLKDRLPLHEQWNPAVHRGASAVLVVVIQSQADRDYFERCLIQRFQPDLNTHHKEVPGILGSLADFDLSRNRPK